MYFSAKPVKFTKNVLESKICKIQNFVVRNTFFICKAFFFHITRKQMCYTPIHYPQLLCRLDYLRHLRADASAAVAVPQWTVNETTCRRGRATGT